MTILREIGSEFWDVPVTDKPNSLFPKSTQWFISGRSALQAIIQELVDCKTVAMPSWCCETMIKPFVDAGKKVLFYPVFQQEGKFNRIVRLDSDVLVLLDYFGYILPPVDLKNYKGTVVRDLTHSFFSKNYEDADFYFGSFRKWCGVWTGGYAWPKDGHPLAVSDGMDYGYTALREQAMEEKRKYMNTKDNEASEMERDKNYLSIYEEAEIVLSSIGNLPAAGRDIGLMHQVDVNVIKQRRRRNAKILMEVFSDWLLFPDLKDDEVPMFVPIMVPNGERDNLKQYLIKNRIYCPVHWPISFEDERSHLSNGIYEHELSLVCDQRYTENDMAGMVKIIKGYFEG